MSQSTWRPTSFLGGHVLQRFTLARPFVTLRSDIASLHIGSMMKHGWKWSELCWAAWASTVGCHPTAYAHAKDEDDRQVGIAGLMLQMSEFLVTWLGAPLCLQITLLATDVEAWQAPAFNICCQKARRKGWKRPAWSRLFFYLNVGIQNWSHCFIEVKIQQLHWLHMPQPV